MWLGPLEFRQAMICLGNRLVKQRLLQWLIVKPRSHIFGRPIDDLTERHPVGDGVFFGLSLNEDVFDEESVDQLGVLGGLTSQLFVLDGRFPLPVRLVSLSGRLALRCGQLPSLPLSVAPLPGDASDTNNEGKPER